MICVFPPPEGVSSCVSDTCGGDCVNVQSCVTVGRLGVRSYLPDLLVPGLPE
jgi:hypothetical protein